MDFPGHCTRPIGPSPNRIAFVGEAPGETEELTGIPFMGSAGQELNRMLEETGFRRSEVYLTNVLHQRPPGNKLNLWCVPKAETGPGYDLPPLSNGKYLHPGLVPAIHRLRMELLACRPNLVVALGGTATWALLHTGAISKVRGTCATGPLIPGLKVLPTFHPSYVLRSWDSRPIVLSDLLKAQREQHFSEVRRPRRTVYIEPTLEDLEAWERILSGADVLSVDIETKIRQITTIGFAPTRDAAFVFPFWDSRKPGGSYWPDVASEVLAWQVVARLLASNIPKVFQNGLYDLQYLARMGFKVANVLRDTMIKHHALYPEMPKDLGFLGSIYTNEASWKLLRERGRDETKRDE